MSETKQKTSVRLTREKLTAILRQSGASQETITTLVDQAFILPPSGGEKQEQARVDYVLEEAKKRGWGEWVAAEEPEIIKEFLRAKRVTVKNKCLAVVREYAKTCQGLRELNMPAPSLAATIKNLK